MTISARPLLVVLVVAAAAAGARTQDVGRVLAPTGTLRVGVYAGSPTSMVRDAGSGEIRGVSVEVGRELARRLGVPSEQVEFQRIAQVIEGLKSGTVDVTVTNATPARAQDVGFTQPVLAIELGYLVSPRASIVRLEDVRRAGVRIGVTQGGTSQSTLPGLLPLATIVPAASVDAAVEMLSSGSLDVYATNKAILFEMSGRLPRSRVLDGNWGVEQMAIAVPKGRDAAMPYLRDFATAVTRDGFVLRAAERARLRGVVPAEGARPNAR